MKNMYIVRMLFAVLCAAFVSVTSSSAQNSLLPTEQSSLDRPPATQAKIVAPPEKFIRDGTTVHLKDLNVSYRTRIFYPYSTEPSDCAVIHLNRGEQAHLIIVQINGKKSMYTYLGNGWTPNEGNAFEIDIPKWLSFFESVFPAHERVVLLPF